MMEPGGDGLMHLLRLYDITANREANWHENTNFSTTSDHKN